METTFASRVKQFRESKGLAQAAFAERCALTQGNVSQMEQGTEPKQSNVSKILLGFPDLNPEWLLLGSGSMLKDGVALAKKEPMLPGGVVNQFGATERPAGSRPEIQFEESSDYQKPEKPAPKVPANDQEFIQLLVKRITTLEGALAAKETLEAKLHNIIEQQQDTVRFLQDQVRDLQTSGKTDGNQLEAPGTTTETQPRARVKGLRTYEEDATQLPEACECVVRQLRPIPQEESEAVAA